MLTVGALEALSLEADDLSTAGLDNEVDFVAALLLAEVIEAGRSVGQSRAAGVGPGLSVEVGANRAGQQVLPSSTVGIDRPFDRSQHRGHGLPLIEENRFGQVA